MNHAKKSHVQLAYNSYAMALVDVMEFTPVEKANTLLARRKSILESSFRCSLRLLKIMFDPGDSKWKVVQH